ncbi:hypothetical protein SAMN04488034_104157 [Salinimicrobium catena]|uniref:Uncharacterized protein n=1 Tax=Salinimicrobium catena TaxID=390640 RepID=A0A1H5NII8_9FLAO|nr:DUF6588 family protein [Salinimicrobium catena]SDL45632.1 hypothetical protein SAMN04488140_104157 [Salinimicrobium catena]SEF00538.1 hypothetical protein SAMN04488034_104157 [Salinimicrobium catena]
MKKILLLSAVMLCSVQSWAQDNLGRLLAAGIEDTKTFATEYLRPGTQATVFNLSNGWYQSAEVKDKLGFEFSIIGNAAVNLGDHQSFNMRTVDYQNIQFVDGSSEKNVSTLLGHNPEPVNVYLEYDTPLGKQQAEITLPDGLAAAGVEMVPAAFLQARLGVFKGTEVKARYFPKVNYDNVQAELYGAALQHEITSWFPTELPVAVSGLVGYTRMNGSYDFTEQNYLDGENQRIKTNMDSWLFSGIVSTNLPVINFYGGLGYMTGSSDSAMLGTYIIKDENTGIVIDEIEDPFTIVDDINGIKANLGMALKLGFFKITGDYSFQEYDALSVGLHLGF